ncbi:hypothetical protein [Prevotella sp. 10(H)]|uniref:hypothetical protein n=1 Tax=Prevotella sp. 10(H) TaxID=1158294 RepID=UPI0009DE491A|nr:hypothetical protein [Prevotella sp. 10(H)]
MEKLHIFLTNNGTVILGMLLGLMVGFAHWYYFGCYWGTYPLSSECWVNCSFGIIVGGFISCLLRTKKI